MSAAVTKGAEKEIVIVLTGNPNSGKTSVFNVLTGLHQKVGNYPGITVGAFDHLLNNVFIMYIALCLESDDAF